MIGMRQGGPQHSIVQKVSHGPRFTTRTFLQGDNIRTVRQDFTSNGICGILLFPTSGSFGRRLTSRNVEGYKCQSFETFGVLGCEDGTVERRRGHGRRRRRRRWWRSRKAFITLPRGWWWSAIHPSIYQRRGGSSEETTRRQGGQRQKRQRCNNYENKAHKQMAIQQHSYIAPIVPVPDQRRQSAFFRARDCSVSRNSVNLHAALFTYLLACLRRLTRQRIFSCGVSDYSRVILLNRNCEKCATTELQCLQGGWASTSRRKKILCTSGTLGC